MFGMKILSDGKKMVIITGGRSYCLSDALLTSFNVGTNRNMYDMSLFGSNSRYAVPGLFSVELDMTIQGGMIELSDKENFFLEEESLKFIKQVNKEVKELALKRSLEF